MRAAAAVRRALRCVIRTVPAHAAMAVSFNTHRMHIRRASNRLLAKFRNAMTLHHLKINRFRFHWLQMRCIDVKRIDFVTPIFDANGAFRPRPHRAKYAARRDFKRISDFDKKRQTIADRPKAATGCAARGVISANGSASFAAWTAAPTGAAR
ncbi:hypothetical protein [Burkholderia sp. ABCPW 111]|uniref:hypothetical protein n=1 Tax=Burkholderia sp. ABCPW 111 TaxID=1820025 RepID=UPI0013785B9C|nr:hypothetical protein [Burkholderia sp. ABCPW 111]